MSRPLVKPSRANFSSGPCVKYPGWRIDNIPTALVGRSHRAADSLAQIRLAMDKTRKILRVPEDYKVALTPGSATGAFEMGLWNLIGQRGVDVFAWDVFGRVWVRDILERLQLNDVHVYDAPLGVLPPLSQANFDRDVIFTWNGSTGGVCVPNGEWIPEDRRGLTFCDATSAAFAYELPWDKLDITAFSWQKALGGEAAHGMVILSPRAMDQLQDYTPRWPVPSLLRLKNGSDITMNLFEGMTLNTPSMLCVEDFLLSLQWAENLGGLPALINKAAANKKIIQQWAEDSEWAKLSAQDPEYTSHTTVCLSITSPWFQNLDREAQWSYIDKFCHVLREEKVAYDINNHRFDSPSLRVWCGPTVEGDDLKKLTPWLDWAYTQTRVES